MERGEKCLIDNLEKMKFFLFLLIIDEKWCFKLYMDSGKKNE